MSAARRIAWLAAIAASASLTPDARAQTRAQQVAQEAFEGPAREEQAALLEGRPTPAPTTQADKPPAIWLNLAQAGVPGSMPWEEPAVVSYRIDRDGEDTYDIQLDGSVDVEILRPRLAGRRRRRGRIIAVREIRWCHVRGFGSGAGRAVETSLVKIRLYG